LIKLIFVVFSERELMFMFAISSADEFLVNVCHERWALHLL